jgi:hypothetical protein
MTAPLEIIPCCANLPAAALPLLGPLRTRPGLRVTRTGDRAWLHWTAGDETVARYLFSICGATLLHHQDGLWFPVSSRLPMDGVPSADNGVPLMAVLVPAAIHEEQAGSVDVAPLPLSLGRDTRIQSATAIRADAKMLARWADSATSHQLSALQGAWCGAEILLRGRMLPSVPNAERYWGQNVLVPLGFRTEPELPEAALCEVLDLAPGETALLSSTGLEVLPAAAFGPVTRASLRRAGEGR